MAPLLRRAGQIRGGDSSAVQQLKSVQQLYASGGAFAAILENGSIVAWGYPESGGDSCAVQYEMKWQACRFVGKANRILDVERVK